jgi:hypothetical protein
MLVPYLMPSDLELLRLERALHQARDRLGWIIGYTPTLLYFGPRKTCALKQPPPVTRMWPCGRNRKINGQRVTNRINARSEL